MDRDDLEGVRLAELVAVLSLGTDLGLGQPMEYVLRQCLVGLRLAERIGLDESERAVVYYVGLLAWVGCHSDAHEQAKWFGDDIAVKADIAGKDLTGPVSGVAFILRNLGAGRPPVQRVRTGLDFLLHGSKWLNGIELSHCAAAGLLAEQLGLDHEVRNALQYTFERWDGKGPAGLSGEDVPVTIRLVALADVVAMFHRAGGTEAALEIARQRSGAQVGPDPRAVLRRRGNAHRRRSGCRHDLGHGDRC